MMIHEKTRCKKSRDTVPFKGPEQDNFGLEFLTPSKPTVSGRVRKKKIIWKHLKVWWQDATLFVYFDFINTYIHSITIHSSVAIR
jgi:hypothetical protein